ncbi:NtaA/DmoA family FMN-dependent monooxygenase [Agromyces kandeliae]|uniref:NtaA/DmoA family FMN-dependent monooxygenase n=1 Tax=Agromyces kandeliae TaxID=2666141 RepID=A0A6L5R015_9MICO|nr:NtaA/DmoA family FMN-dependent monooxygenase [Agromyces kandeliae]MRX43330.1 NtaA/DmoA family FMN-dependent monooxygenase [Agromyces kandeliae]
MKQLRFGLFENAQANDSGTATWRHPDNRRDQFDTLAYWRDIARMSEEADFDFVFLADAWGWADVNGQRPEICSVEGLDLPRLDPTIVGAAMVAETDRLGVVMTGSILLEQPYAFARRMASLDQLSGGRIGWNVVTTGTAETAVQAFGVPMVPHDERYRMADDFMQVVYKLWEGAWEPGALERDKQGRFADPTKVHRIAHDGPYFRSHGYGNTAYTPQGTPVLFQAGASPAGRAFGGRHGECMFVGSGSAEQLGEHSRAIRAEAAASGRSADDVKVMSAFACVVGRTIEDARRKYERVLDSQDPGVAVASYAWFTGLDLSSYAPETPMTELHTELSQTQVARFAGQTVGDVLKDWHAHGVGARPVIGTPEDVADVICDLADRADLDGFLLSPVIQPGSTLDFIEHVLPILRERGVASPGGDEGTLRERLMGKGSPTLGDRHPAAAARPAVSAA